MTAATQKNLETSLEILLTEWFTLMILKTSKTTSLLKLKKEITSFLLSTGFSENAEQYDIFNITAEWLSPKNTATFFMRS